MSLKRYWPSGLLLLLLLLAALACNGSAAGILPTRAPVVVPTIIVVLDDPGSGSGLPPTWTPRPDEVVVLPGGERLPTLTPRPSRTPPNLPTITPRPSNTPPPSATPDVSPTPTAPPLPTLPAGPNLLPNPSFEEGWYHIDNIPELQLPNQWNLEWEQGHNPLDPDPWNAWVRPEARVLTPDFLPPNERDLFILDGEQTVKIFKGRGSINFRFYTFAILEPGSYLFTINFFPDMVDAYLPDGTKIWAPDPLSGEVRFIVGDTATGYVLPPFGQWTTLTHAFIITETQGIRLGAQFRGRWAIENNGWFMDDWSLVRIGD